MTDVSSDIGFVRNKRRKGGLSEPGFVEGRAFRAALHLALLRPRLSADLGGSGGRHGGDGARRGPSRRHHRVGRLQRARLSDAVAGAIDAVDLNTAHVALNRLKLAAVRHLPSQADLFRFFGGDGNATTPRPMTASSRRISTRRRAPTGSASNWRGKRRIAVFDQQLLPDGLLGFFIAAGHRVARSAWRRSVAHHGGAHARANSAASSRSTWRRSSIVRCIALGDGAQGFAVRPRHSAGAVRLADTPPATARWPTCCRRGWKSSPAISR